MANIGATAVLKATFDSKDFDQGCTGRRNELKTSKTKLKRLKDSFA